MLNRAFMLIRGLILSAALVAVYLWRLWVLGEVPVASPVHNITDPGAGMLAYAPGWEVLKRVLHEGASLLWTEARNAGTPPAYEEVSAAFFHPWSWLCNLFEFAGSWRFYALSLMFLLSLAHVAIARRIFRFRWPATCAFVQLAVFNLFLMRNVNHVYLLVYTGAAWTWFFLLDSLSDRERDPGPRYWAGIFAGEALGIAWGLCGGFPEATFPHLVMGAILLGAGFFLAPRPLWRKAAVVAVLAALTGAALSAIPISAFVEGLRQWTRFAPAFRDEMGYGHYVPWYQMPRFLLLLEVEGANVVYYCVGAVALVLACLGWRSTAARRLPPVFRVTLVTSALFFLVHVSHLLPPLSRWIASVEPFRSANFYGYFVPLLSFPVAWLAACGVERLCSGEIAPRFPRPALGVLLGILVLLHVLPHSTLYGSNYLRLIPVLFVAWCLRRGDRWPGVAGLLLLIFAEQCATMFGFRYATESEARRQQFGVLDARVEAVVCAPGAREYRWHWLDKITPRFCANQPDSFASATPLVRNHRLKMALFGRDLPELFIRRARQPYAYALMSIRWLGATADELARLRAWSVPYLTRAVLPGGAQLVELPDALPRAYLARSCDWVDDAQSGERLFASGRYRLGAAVLEGGAEIRPAWTAVCGEKAAAGHVPIARESGARVELAAVRGPGVLVLQDSFYPGWSAREIGGAKLPMIPANLAFRAVRLDEDRPYHIEFVYQPAWLPAARVVTAGAALAILSALFFCASGIPRRSSAGSRVPRPGRTSACVS